MLSIRSLIWDSWNIAHIAHHDVTPDEVEEVCHNDPLVQMGKKGRLLVIGFSKKGRMLTAIIDEKSRDVYYPVTARSTGKKERKIYQDEKGGVK